MNLKHKKKTHKHKQNRLDPIPDQRPTADIIYNEILTQQRLLQDSVDLIVRTKW